jgi:hypothetical protein
VAMETYAPYLVHIAAVFTLLCYLFRNQIRLRVFAALGDAVLVGYYYFAFAVPLWSPLVWSVLNVIINAVMILIILRDQRGHAMSDKEMNLFRMLDTLTPGQFRKLTAKGEWKQADEPTVLAKESEVLDQLHYVLDGSVAVVKAGRQLQVEPKLFIGELAYLRKRPATATVTVSGGGHYMTWKHTDLEELFKRNDDLRNAMLRLLGRDMAEKMANT